MKLWGALLLTAAIVLPPVAMAAPAARAAAPQAQAQPRQILLQADSVEYDGDAKTVAAIGHVEIADEGRVLIADRVTYDQVTDKVTANGHVSLTDAKGNVSFADHVVLTDHMREGALSGFGALIGKNGRLVASNAQRHDGGNLYVANSAAYTPCKLCKTGGGAPLWEVKARHIVYDELKHRVHFSDASVSFFGVPILYTPVLTTPDPTVHYASGLLTPDLGNSSKIGYFARLPVYIALSPSNDLTLSPMFSTLGGDIAETEYRARWNNSGFWLQGSIGYNPTGGLGGNAAGPQVFDHLFGSGRFDLGSTWRSGFDAQLTNNSAYMRFYDISSLDRLVNDLFVENDSGRSRLAVTGYFFQGLRSTDLASQFPYVAPLLDYSFIPSQNVAGGQFRFDLNGLALSRGSGFDQQRITAELNWKVPFILGGGQLWTFVADARGDAYRLLSPSSTPGSSGTSTMLSRGVPYVALDWRWPFLSQGDTGRSYILEPIAQVVAQPYGGNPAALFARAEDSGDFEFSDTNIFSFNQLPGYDLVESGPRANVGFNAEALFPGGEVQALVGQTYRLKPDPVLTALAGDDGTASDVVGRFSVKFAHLDITDRIDVDRGNGSVNRHEIYLTSTYSRSSFQVSYVQLPPEAVALGLGSREEINGQADINFYENWQAFAAAQRDLLSGQFLNLEYGLGYENDCIAVSLAYRRKFTFDTVLGVPPSTSVILRFSLKTGDQPVQPFSLFPQNVFDAVRP